MQFSESRAILCTKVAFMVYLLHKFVMDEFDRTIANALQRDASLTNAQLAEIVNLSPSQCSRRKSALEDSGVIQGYTANLNPKAMGYNLRAIVRINLSSHGGTSDNRFSQFLSTCDEILEAHSVSGDADYVLNVHVHSLDSFADFIHNKLLPHPCVSQVRSEIILKTLKS